MADENEYDRVIKSADSRLIPWLPTIFGRLLEVCFAWIFWIFGSDFQAAGHKCVGYGFNCLAIISFLLLAADMIFGRWPNRKVVLIGFIISCAAPIITYTYLCIGEPSARTGENPHFTYSLHMADAPSISLALTNDYLIFDKYFGKSTPIPGILFVPKPNGRSNFVLQFVVYNDSSTMAEDVAFRVSFPKDWQCVPPTNWIKEKEVDNSQSKDSLPINVGGVKASQSFMFRSPFALLPKNGMRLPNLPIMNVSDSQYGVFSIVSHSKNSPNGGLGFALYFAPPSEMVFHKPFVQLGNLTPEGAIDVFVPYKDSSRQISN